MGLRRSFEYALLGVPHGPLGHVGAWLMASMKGKFYGCMASELDLQAGDELLDVGCGSARFFAEHAGHVRYVAGIDASELQIEMARKRLAERIAAGTAEIVLGDAAALPWEDSRFGVVTSLDTMKFTSDPGGALAEMHRVLRPGGRAVFTMGDNTKALLGRTDKSGTRDAWGVWFWSDADAARLVEEAGFTDISVTVLPVPSKSQLVRAAKSASTVAASDSEWADPVGEPVA
jgi:SAM-dependent methyltransferase